MRLGGRLLAALALAAGVAHAADIPIADFFKRPQYTQMQISPDGKHLAALAPVLGRQNLVLLDLTGRKAQPITSMDGIDVVAFQWLNSRRLLFYTGSLEETLLEARRGELIAIDLDGSAPYRISRRARGLTSSHWMVRTLPGESDAVIMQDAFFGRYDVSNRGLVRLDTRTHESTVLDLDKPESGQAERWLVDNKGVARALTASLQGKVVSFYRASAKDPWIKVEEHAATAAPGLSLLALDEDGDGLYVSVPGERGLEALHKWSPATRAPGPKIASHPQVDLSWLVQDEGKVVGVRYSADRSGVAWFDETLARVQDAIDRALPDTVNTLQWSRDRKRFLVSSLSDKLPGAFYLFDVGTGKLEWLADRAPWIKPADMASQRAVRYKARDGLEIPGFLTLPKGAAGSRLPLVVVVHGGPHVRGATYGFNSEAQFLASRGYAVLEPNFRGSTGYGWKHFSAGFRQWGLAMQDDVTDGVLWAIEQGIADPKRVCIMGGSYGGYAAMMGLAKTPELYRCGVNAVGVTDLPLLLTATWSDQAYTDFRDFIAKDVIGDPDRDRAALEANSPARLADRMRGAIFMAYGALDARVPIAHGTMMRSALDKAGRKYEWLLIEDEGHGFRSLDNRLTYYRAVERFLAEHLK